MWSIANRFNTTVNELRTLNQLTSDILQIGQMLNIPTIGTTTTTYTVQVGDSLWSIANRFNTTVNELRTLNQLTTDILQVGQILTIPS